MSCARCVPLGRAPRKGLRASRVESSPYGDNNIKGGRGVAWFVRWGAAGGPTILIAAKMKSQRGPISEGTQAGMKYPHMDVP